MKVTFDLEQVRFTPLDTEGTVLYIPRDKHTRLNWAGPWRLVEGRWQRYHWLQVITYEGVHRSRTVWYGPTVPKRTVTEEEREDYLNLMAAVHGR